VAIVFASDSEGEYMEKACASVDCTTSGKTGNQDDLITSVAAANPNTIAVLETGDPVVTPWRGSVKGLLEAWYPGQEGGAAIARVLFGDVDPGGRLPATFPDSESQLATYGDPTAYPGAADVYYKEGVFVGYRWFDARNLTPAFPFGFGLSYTTFGFSHLRIQLSRPGSGSVATVSATATNTGKRTGLAVPQLYLGLPSPSSTVLQPPRQLRGFTKLSLAPGESKTVSFPLDNRAFSYWDVGTGSWQITPGCYGVFLGSSSRDLPLQGVIARGNAVC
jgi:beta-glucosidase